MALNLGGPVYDWLRQLRPPGHAWTSNPSSVVQRLLRGLSGEFDRIVAMLVQLREEADPRTTFALLPDWESQYGLPEPCPEPPETYPERIAALVEKVTRRGGASRAYFIGRAAQIGFTITITEYLPHTFGSGFDEALVGIDWVYRWDVNAPSETVTYFQHTSGFDEPLANWGNQRLECLLNGIKPGHTILKFTYGA